jgi:hypothetical protein
MRKDRITANCLDFSFAEDVCDKIYTPLQLTQIFAATNILI